MKIKYKIAIALLSVVTLLGLLLTYIEYSRTLERENELLKNTGLSIARNSSFNIFHHLSTNDLVEAQRMINSIKEKERDILYVFVLSPEKKVVIHTFNKKFPVDLLTFNTGDKENIKLIQYGDESAYDFSYPIGYGEFGILRIGISRKNIIAYLNQNLIISLELLALFFVLGLVVILFLSRLLTNPIYRLIEAVEKVANGDYSVYSPAETNDEIGKLSLAFNGMVKDLRASKEQLEETYEEAVKELQLRKETEKKLSGREKFLKEIFNAITNPIMVFNADDYTVETFNGAARFEHIGDSTKRRDLKCYSFTHGRDEPCGSDEHPCPLEIIKQTRQPTKVEHIHKDKNNNQRFFEVNAFPIFDEHDKLKQIIEYSIDITESKRSEEELLKVKLGIERLNDPVFITNVDGEISYVNPGFGKVYGYTPDEVLGKTPRILKSGKIPLEVYKDLWNTLLNKEVFTAEFINRTKDGKLITLSVSINPILDIENNLLGFLAIQYDISDKKLIEKNLIKAKEKAENADKLKSIFLAQMSHEIRTPINAMLSLSSLLKDDLEEQVDEDSKISFELINKAGMRIIRTVDLLLNLSEIQAGTYEIITKKFDLYSDVLGKIVVDYKKQAEDKNISFRMELETKDTEIVADAYTVEQIFTQLMDNAVKYTTEGIISIKIVRNGEEKLIAEISDTGIGIAEEYLPELFTPFSQEDSGYTRKYEGNGIGLALVKKYCELNNATIEVESEKGVGSTFRILF